MVVVKAAASMAANTVAGKRVDVRASKG